MDSRLTSRYEISSPSTSRNPKPEVSACCSDSSCSRLVKDAKGTGNASLRLDEREVVQDASEREHSSLRRPSANEEWEAIRYNRHLRARLSKGNWKTWNIRLPPGPDNVPGPPIPFSIPQTSYHQVSSHVPICEGETEQYGGSPMVLDHDELPNIRVDSPLATGSPLLTPWSPLVPVSPVLPGSVGSVPQGTIQQKSSQPQEPVSPGSVYPPWSPLVPASPEVWLGSCPMSIDTALPQSASLSYPSPMSICKADAVLRSPSQSPRLLTMAELKPKALFLPSPFVPPMSPPGSWLEELREMGEYNGPTYIERMARDLKLPVDEMMAKYGQWVMNLEM